MESTGVISGAARILKALGEETRLQIMSALMDGAMTVNEITNNTKVSQSCVSHQLKSLKELRLVKSERKGRCIYYSLNDNHISGIMTQTFVHVQEEVQK